MMNRLSRFAVGIVLVISAYAGLASEGDVIAMAEPGSQAEQSRPAEAIPAEPVAASPQPIPLLVVRSFETNPRRVVAGQPFDLILEIHNATNRQAENILVSVGGGAAAEAGGGLAILGTGNAKPVSRLRGNRQVDVSFDVVTTPGTTAGALTAPVNVSFEFEGQRHEVAYTIGLIVERLPVFSLVAAEVPSNVMAGESFTASFELANVSGFALRSAKLSVEATGATVTEGSLFIGGFEDEMTESLESTIMTQEPGEVEVVLVLEYRDELGALQSWRETRTVIVEEPVTPGDGGEAPAADAEQADEHWLVAFFKSLFGLGG